MSNALRGGWPPEVLAALHVVVRQTVGAPHLQRLSHSYYRRISRHPFFLEADRLDGHPHLGPRW